MDSHNILSFLGLALRGGNLAVGEEPVEAAVRGKDARLLLLASDAAENTCRRAERFAETGQCLLVRLPFSKAELGRAVGRTSAAVTAVTDIGMANALGRKLSALDPVRYGAAAERLEVKARRAAQRKEEQRAHEKNLRQGKRRRKKPEAPPERAAARPGTREREKAGAGPGGMGKRPRQGTAPPRRKKLTAAGGDKRAPRPYAHSRPVKKGKGSFRKREDGRPT